ncbi:MAG TPA: type II secretion system protein [Bacteroidia bacterium]|nr:type II secretion system protein [Bacteroidia bacterium]
MAFNLINTMKLFSRHKKLKAFTLLELLVGMILSGIVLTATFSAYRIITRQYETYCDKSETISELSFFVSQFQSDFSNATNITRISENEIQLQSGKRILDYKFSGKRVLRNDFSRTDTFNVSVPEMETFWKSEKVNSENQESDELHLQINFENRKTEKIYLKMSNAKSEIDKIESDFDTSRLNNW